MFPQQTLLRASRRCAGQLRPSPIRAPVQRRLASSGPASVPGAKDNAFNRERQAIKDHAAATSDLWRKLVVIPCLIVGSVNAYNLWTEHWEHWDHMPPLEERPEYSYQNMRTKNFFWGDGDKTLFWNDKVNFHKKADE
ncbi:MAG: Cytochrome c oxidase subunit 6A, mitochondrial [Thelocarpon impressellum]|nr:MAG: Cytochrome c oxidase subunit 6A, mitochondrial [Thelocarpon impressellum]